MDARITPNWAQLRLLATLAITVIVASCVPARAATDLAPLSKDGIQTGTALARAVPPDPAMQEEISRKVAELLVPVSNEAAAPFDNKVQTPDDQQRSLNCLTAAIYYEARSEPEEGQRAVAQVVLNRVRHPAFPSTVCGVVYQGHERSTGCQFSFTCDGSMNRPIQPRAWERSRLIAAQALAGSVYAPVGNATHYHTLAVHPYWAAYLQKSAIIGAHIFYRWNGTAGEASAFRQHYGGLEPAPSFVAETIAAGVRMQAGVTIHVGVSSGTSEQLSLDDGMVTVHRSGRAAISTAAVEPAQQESRPAAQPAGEVQSFGVTIHRGGSASTS